MTVTRDLILLFLSMVLLSSYVLGATNDTDQEDTTLSNENIFGIIPDCVFGVSAVSFIVYTSKIPDGKPMAQNETVCPEPEVNKVVFLTHGFVASPYSSDIQSIVSALIRSKYVMVYALDWSKAACDGSLNITDVLAYGKAVRNSYPVGVMMANTIIRLANNCPINTNSVTLVGHSLGAQVSSFAAKHLQQNGITVPILVGLDPAGPLFRQRSCQYRICETDAKYVLIYHTSFLYGMSMAVGDCDFYFNGGAFQPGCVLQTCSHSRSEIYFANSLYSDCSFIGLQWTRDTVLNSTILDCTAQNCTIVGLQSAGKCSGEYYVPTRTVPPYCLNSTASIELLENRSTFLNDN